MYHVKAVLGEEVVSHKWLRVKITLMGLLPGSQYYCTTEDSPPVCQGYRRQVFLSLCSKYPEHGTYKNVRYPSW